MSKTVIQTPKAPLPIGPYHQAIKSGHLIFTAGQIPLDVKTGAVCEGEIEAQTELVITHLKNILESAGSSLEKVVKTTVFLKEMNDFPKMNEVYQKYFTGDQAPARSAVQVARLPKDVLIEIEAVAEV